MITTSSPGAEDAGRVVLSVLDKGDALAVCDAIVVLRAEVGLRRFCVVLLQLTVRAEFHLTKS
jgi:hypothetical protein